jgi:hypothetical protein
MRFTDGDPPAVCPQRTCMAARNASSIVYRSTTTASGCSHGTSAKERILAR